MGCTGQGADESPDSDWYQYVFQPLRAPQYLYMLFVTSHLSNSHAVPSLDIIECR